MDADTILRMKPALTSFVHGFDGCFGRSQTRGHLATYVQGQLSNPPRKSVEPMAGTPRRTLQEFLSLSRWDEPMMRDRLQQRVARRHGCRGHARSVGVIDETRFVKKGNKTACV